MNLWSRLGLDPAVHRTVALVGGGGKTTLLYALAQEARAARYPVVVTTTTHMFPHPRLRVTDDPAAVEAHGIIQLGRVGADGKLAGVGRIAACAARAVTLVEADGSRRLPLKLPAAHEPVIPPESDAVIAVAGASAVGRSIGAVCHRAELVCRLLGKSEDEAVTLADIGQILAQKKGVLPHMTYVSVLNQADCIDGTSIPPPLIPLSFDDKERGGLCWF